MKKVVFILGLTLFAVLSLINISNYDIANDENPGISPPKTFALDENPGIGPSLYNDENPGI